MTFVHLHDVTSPPFFLFWRGSYYLGLFYAQTKPKAERKKEKFFLTYINFNSRCARALARVIVGSNYFYRIVTKT